jgi:putative phosphoribosyl transferase
MAGSEGPRRFADRREAGERLAAELAGRDGKESIVLGLPRGGVVVAAAVAEALGLQLDVLVVGKLGMPGRPELGLGAVGEGGVLVVNDASTRIGQDQLVELEREVRGAVDRRAHRLRQDRPRVALKGREAIIVDDGIATGATARAACAVARDAGASRIVVAVPVAPRGAADVFEEVADGFVCVWTPERFFAVGEFYEDFAPVTEDEVVAHRSSATTP